MAKPASGTPFADPAKVGNTMASARFPFGANRDNMVALMEGGVFLRKDGTTSFRNSPMNLALAAKHFLSVAVALPNTAPVVVRPPRAAGTYSMRTSPFGAYQAKAYTLCRDVEAFGLFMDTGTGKTKVAIDATGHQYAQGWIDAVLVITLRGVHNQWVGTAPDSPLPKHLGYIDGKPIQYRAYAWDGKRPPPFPAVYDGVLEIFTINFEALVRSNSAPDIVNAFIERHKGRLRTIVDESHRICNFTSGQTECCIDIGERSASRLAMSGTPVPKSPEDEWVQSLFLDESIFGMRFRSSFRAKYARVIKGDVVGWKNLDEVREIMASHVFRVTSKEALGLPDKVYDKFYFDIPAQARKHYNELRQNFLTQLNSGEVITVQSAAVLFMRLQQITCGSLVGEDGVHHEVDNGRSVALAELLAKFERNDRFVVWARFKRDIDAITAVCKKLGGEIGYLVGGQTASERAQVVADWQSNGKLRFIVGNPAAGGTGTDGLQYDVAATVYYSNSFNSVERWQSEDRTYRIGTDRTKVPLYYDLIAKSSIDDKILANLKNKKDMADLLLGDFLEILA